jgi:hypothetical protein
MEAEVFIEPAFGQSDAGKSQVAFGASKPIES